MYNWQLIFAINIPIALVIIYYSNKLLPNVTKDLNTKFDALGTFLLISSLACLSVGISNLKSSHFIEAIISLKVLPFIIYPIIALPIFYKVEHKAQNALIKPELMHNPVLRIAFLIGLCAGLAEAAVIFVPSMLKQTYGVTESTASFMLMPMVFAMLIGALAAGKSTDKLGPRATLIIAGILVTIGFVIVGMAGEFLIWLYAGGVLIGISLAALLGAPLRYIVNRNTESGVRASGQGLITISTGTGQIISAALLGALITSLGNDAESYKSSFLIISIVGIFALILATRLPKK
jgi:MFS family permease